MWFRKQISAQTSTRGSKDEQSSARRTPAPGSGTVSRNSPAGCTRGSDRAQPAQPAGRSHRAPPGCSRTRRPINTARPIFPFCSPGDLGRMGKSFRRDRAFVRNSPGCCRGPLGPSTPPLLQAPTSSAPRTPKQRQNAYGANSLNHRRMSTQWVCGGTP